MKLVDYKKNPKLYAQIYAKLEITGTQFLAFRDLPEKINNYIKGKKTLDYGSGAAKSTTWLKSNGLDVEGVDINPEMVENARQKDPSGIYNVIDSGKVNCKDETYDMVFASWVLMEISTKSEMQKVLNEHARILKSNGLLIVVVCNQDTYNTEWLSYDTRFEENKKLSSGSRVKIFFKDVDLTIYDYFWTHKDYEETILSAGLEILEIHNPLGKDSDGYKWINEEKKSPCTIFIARKP